MEVTGTVANGDYKGIAFKVGVPEDLNHSVPSNQQAPLDAKGMWWAQLPGYRYAKIEVVNTDRSNAEVGRGQFHVGAGDCSGDLDAGVVDCGKSNRNDVSLEAFDPEDDTVVIDVAELFKATDLTIPNECHASSDNCQSMFAAWGLDYASGNPQDGQSVFSKE